MNIHGIDFLATIIVLGLATWRLARVIPTDTVAEPLRDRITMWSYPEAEISARQAKIRPWIGKLLACEVCLGFWFAAAVTAFWSLVVTGAWLGWSFVIVWPAVAAVSAITSLQD